MWKKKEQQTIPERPEEEEEASLDKHTIRNKTHGNKIEKILESHHNQRRYKDEFSLNLFSQSKDKTKKKLLEKDYFTSNIKENFSKSTSFPFIYSNSHSHYDDNFKEIKLILDDKEEIKTTKFDTKHNDMNTNQTEINFDLAKYASTNTEKMRLYIRYKEAYNFFLSLNTSDKRNQVTVEDFSQMNFCRKIFLGCTKRFVLQSELHAERHFIFSTAKIEYNEDEETHTRILTTIYKSFTGELECPLQGPHWLKVGFQSNQPGTDLRGVGMFGAVQLLAFVDRYQQLARSIYSLSESMDGHFPVSSVLLNFTFDCLRNLKQGHLIPVCNKRNSVLDTMNVLYFGMIDYLVADLNTNTTLEQMPLLLQKINKLLKDNPQCFISREEKLSQRFPHVLDSMSLGEYRD